MQSLNSLVILEQVEETTKMAKKQEKILKNKRLQALGLIILLAVIVCITPVLAVTQYLVVFNSTYEFDDTYITADNGMGADGNSNLDTQSLNVFSRAGFANQSILIRYNISMLQTILPANSNITTALLNLTIQSNNLGAGEAMNTTACLIENNFNWVEETITFNTFNFSRVNASYCSPIVNLRTGDTGMKSWNITSALNKSYLLGLSNFSILISGNNQNEGALVPNDYVTFKDKEISNISIYLSVFYIVGDYQSPAYFNQSYDKTRAGSTANFSLFVSDNLQLNGGGVYIFSTNNSGAWVNETAVAFSNTLTQWIGTQKVLNSTIGLGIGYNWWFNDSSGNTNSTPTYILNTTEYQEITNCQNLTGAGEKYLLKNDIIDSTFRSCFIMKEDNITLNCENHLVDGTHLWDGVNNLDYSVGSKVFGINSTIENCKFTDWSYGINLRNSNYTTITNITISRSWEHGIRLTLGGHDLSISNIISKDNGLGTNGAGIYCEYINQSRFNNITTWDTPYPGVDITLNSMNNIFSNIKILNSSVPGFVLEFSSNNNSITNLSVYNTTAGLFLNRVGRNYITNSIFSNNQKSADGLTGYGIYSALSGNISLNNIIINSNNYGLYIYSSRNISIENSTITNQATRGINLLDAYNISIKNISSSYNGNGFYGSVSEGINITNSRFFNNSINGIYMSFVANSMFWNITINNNTAGILSEGACENNIYDNIIVEYNNNTGIIFNTVQDNIIKNSIIRRNKIGINMTGGSFDNSIYNNWFFNNIYNTKIETTLANFFNVTKQLGDRIVGSAIYIGGNYYTKLVGNGISETCVDNNFDGFCDLTMDMSIELSGCSVNNCDYLAYSSSSYTELYNTTTFESSLEYFKINITYGSSYLTIGNAYLIYNGVSFAGTKAGVGNNITFTTSIAIPVVPVNGQNLSFYWSIGLTNSSGTIYYNTSAHNQTIYKGTSIFINSTCPDGFSSALLFNSFYETNRSEINFTQISYYITYGLSGNSSAYTINDTLSNVASFSICINNSQPYYDIGYGEIQYYVDGHSPRRYYIFGGTRIINTTISIPIYSLNSTKSTSFLITAETTSLQPYINHYIGLLRWYPEMNSYQTVELGKTDDKGQTVLHINTEDVDYRFAIYSSNGNLVKLFAPTRLVCQTTPCIYTLYVDTNPLDLTTWGNIESSLTFNRTSMQFIYIWNDPTQMTQTMNLSVWKDGTISSELICSTTSTGYTGVMICDVTGFTGTLRAEVTRTVSPTIPIAQLIEKIGTTFIDAGGGTLGLFIGALLLILFAFIGVASPVLVIILAVIALIPLYFLGSINAAVMMGVGVFGGIILHTLRRTT